MELDDLIFHGMKQVVIGDREAERLRAELRELRRKADLWGRVAAMLDGGTDRGGLALDVLYFVEVHRSK